MMTEVCLVHVPYGCLERPSLALSMLKAGLRRAGIDCRLLYTTFDFAEGIGRVSYTDLVWVRGEMVGEWTFAGAAFPDFAADHDEYLDRVAATFAPGGGAAAQQVRHLFRRIRRQAEAFIEQTARRVLEQEPRIVGCSSTFNQHCAALALTRRIKELDPSVTTILGGGNCEGEMGLTTLREFPWLDLVVSGEADQLFPELCARVLAEGPDLAADTLPYGVFAAVHRRQEVCWHGDEVPRAMVEDLDACPIPDFSDYFEALGRYAERGYVTPGLLVETSRGCWWGMVQHCTFCGLNGGGMAYRSKSAGRAVTEIRQLARQYGVHRFLVVDNILDRKYYQEVLPALSELPEEYELFYEIKANTSFEQLQTLAAAGVRWLQPGIEALHDDVLKLMRKGTSTWINVQLLKWARELGLSIGWNLLCGFPGEEDEWYGEVAEWIPLIQHLQPCTELRPIRFDRFSPYQSNPQAFGLRLQPAWPYDYIYPVDREVQSRLIYGFEAEDRPAQVTNLMRLRDERQLPSLGGPGRDLLQQRIREWHDAFLSPLPPILSMTEKDDETHILDTRSVAPAARVVLRGLAHRVHRACHACVTLGQIAAAANKNGDPPVASAAVEKALQDLVDRRLVLRLGKRYLALAEPGDLPVLPRSHREGYPGGWVDRPVRRRRRPAPAPLPAATGRDGVSSVTFDEPLVLDGGAVLPSFTLAYTTYGELAAKRDNAVLVCHPLTKGPGLAGGPGTAAEAGWWDHAVGRGKMLDTGRFFVVCCNVLGGSHGSSGPGSLDPTTGRPYGLRFPVVTVADMVRAQRRLLDHLGIERWHAVIGGCFGGQQALQWAVRYPHAVRRAVVLSATAATSAHTIAIFHVMRRLIRADPAWNGGDYYGATRGGQALPGLAQALVAAVPLWMSREAMEHRFGRRPSAAASAGPRYTLDEEFEVEDYLCGVAARAGDRIDANALLYLTRAIEYFDLAAEHGSLEQAFARIESRVLLVSYRSDWRYPPAEVERMQSALVAAGADSRHLVLDHPLGHGAFVHDVHGLEPALRELLIEEARQSTLSHA